MCFLKSIPISILLLLSFELSAQATVSPENLSCTLGTIFSPLLDNQLAVGSTQLVVNNGNVGIGNAIPTARLDIYGTTTDNTQNALTITSSTGLQPLILGNDGTLTLGLSSTSLTIKSATTVNGNLTVTGAVTSNGTTTFGPSAPIFLQSNVNVNYASSPGLNCQLCVEGQDATSAKNAVSITNVVGANTLLIRDDGRVAIGPQPTPTTGLSWPAEMLEVNGSIKVHSAYLILPGWAAAPFACTTAMDGTIALNGSTYQVCVCIGLTSTTGNWKSTGDGTTSCGSW